MKRKSPKWLDDIRVSSRFILEAIAGKTLEDCQANPILQVASLTPDISSC